MNLKTACGCAVLSIALLASSGCSFTARAVAAREQGRIADAIEKQNAILLRIAEQLEKQHPIIIRSGTHDSTNAFENTPMVVPCNANPPAHREPTERTL